jgi:predicted DNA-binding transcriptional regulator YafY
VGSLDEIINILKGWLPHIKILQPKELKDTLLNDMKAWIGWQEES